MKLGTDFWFWLTLLFEVLKAILGSKDSKSANPTTPGERMFKTVLGKVAGDNEDDKHTAAEVTAL